MHRLSPDEKLTGFFVVSQLHLIAFRQDGIALVIFSLCGALAFIPMQRRPF